jgi:hypothetical protein
MKINLKDVTFIIPIKLDSNDRLNNYTIVINHLTNLFDTNIIVCESDRNSNENLLKIHENIEYVFYENKTDYFHRTKILNIMTKMAKTNIICNYDTDVVFPEQQYISSVNKIKKDNCTIVFPYGGKFMNVPNKFFDLIKNNNFYEIDEDLLELAHPNSLGGAFFFDKEKYTTVGLENENFMSWGFEDNERVSRLQKLNHQICRVPGLLFHLNHQRGVDSVPENPYYRKNMQEYGKINSMSKTDLESYIKNWYWVN